MGARHVAIDYEMKKISAGLLPVHPSVPSLFESGPSSSPCRVAESSHTSATHRFWFTPLYPDRPRFVRDDSGVLIQKPVEVQLQSEEESLRHGERIGGALLNQRPRALRRRLRSSLQPTPSQNIPDCEMTSE